MVSTQNIHDLCEKKARDGDGTFAVAYALLQLADAQRDTARALNKLGFNDDNPKGAPGTTEALAMEVKRIADAMEDRSN